jgi:hypothetical protein
MKFFVVFILCFLLSTSCDINFFSAGSYPYAERYLFDCNLEFIIKEIVALKQKDSTLIPPKVYIESVSNSFYLSDTFNQSSYYTVYIYSKKENKIFYIALNKEDNNRTELLFEGVNKGLELGKWKQINKDLSDMENNHEKEMLNEILLKKIPCRIIY